MSPAVAAAESVSWRLAGWWLADSWRRLDSAVLLFFIGNIAWMTTSAGMLYLDTPQRQCVNYLQDDQREAGIGPLLLAIVMGAVAIRQALSSVPESAATEAAQRVPTEQLVQTKT